LLDPALVKAAGFFFIITSQPLGSCRRQNNALNGHGWPFRSDSNQMAKAHRMTKLTDSKPLVLVLEDEALIAINLQDELQDAGHEVAGPFTDCSAALEWLQTATPDMAILDATLNDGSCHSVAVELSRRGVPLLIYSGHQEDRQLLSDFHPIAWIEKPVPSTVLVQACEQVLVGCG
jgi:CheY-like chemotaxis protein